MACLALPCPALPWLPLALAAAHLLNCSTAPPAAACRSRWRITFFVLAIAVTFISALLAALDFLLKVSFGALPAPQLPYLTGPMAALAVVVALGWVACAVASQISHLMCLHVTDDIPCACDALAALRAAIDAYTTSILGAQLPEGGPELLAAARVVRYAVREGNATRAHVKQSAHCLRALAEVGPVFVASDNLQREQAL